MSEDRAEGELEKIDELSARMLSQKRQVLHRHSRIKELLSGINNPAMKDLILEIGNNKGAIARLGNDATWVAALKTSVSTDKILEIWDKKNGIRGEARDRTTDLFDK